MKNELVHLWRNDVYCDSIVVAEKFSKKHKHVLDKIDILKQNVKDLVAENLNVKSQRMIEIFKEKVRSQRGKDYRYYDMNKPAYSLLVMGFTGKKALKIKRAFNNAFYLMEEVILRQDNLEWQRDREQGKVVRLALTDEVKIFLEYAIAQGSKNANKYYITITKMSYKALSLIEKNEKVNKQFRNILNVMDLQNLLVAEKIVRKALVDGMNQELHYKDIYKLAKQRIEVFAFVVDSTDIPQFQVENNKPKQITLF